MPGFLSEFLSQFKAIWKRLDVGQRWLMAGVMALTLVGLAALVWAAGRPDHQLVLEAQDPREIASAVRALTQASVPFERDGRGISVPRSAVRQAESVLFEAGVLAGGGGNGESDDAFTRMTLDRAARKDLLDSKNRSRAERAVLQIDGVVAATITSSQPPRSVFESQDREQQAGAAVLVKLRPGVGFRSVAAAAIDAVSAALALPRNRITVRNAVTKEGYRIDGETGSSVDSSEFLSQQNTRSRELTERAQAVLDSLYPDQARVVVTVDLDPNWEVRQEKIVPDTPILLTDKIVKTDSNESNGGIGGDPSLAARASEASVPRNSKKDSTSERTYEPFRGTANKGKLAPDVRKITVALVLDEKLQLAASKLENVEKLVKNCVGFESERDGFALHVEKLPEITFESPALTTFGFADLLREYGPLVAQLAGVVLVILFLKSMLKRTAVRPATSAAAPVEEPPEEQLTPEEGIKRMRRDIEKAITEDPAAVSRLLESWLTEVKA